MQHFYDGQIRRYITQLIRLLSNFSYKDGDGKLTTIPVMYGDITRQVAHIIRDNSENKIPSAPRIGVYVTDLAMDRDRTADPSFVSKIHIREREYDNDEGYLNTQGKNYTVERLMPTPYTLTVSADIWSTNTEQKLQIMEQILMLFNPSLEIQTTDNYVDWTSLTVVNLENVTFSSRSIPIGTESDIDVATLQLTTPIYISPPVKVKKLGVIQSVIMSIFDESRGTIDLGQSMPELQAYDDSNLAQKDGQGTSKTNTTGLAISTYQDYDMVVLNNIAQIIDKGITGKVSWEKYLDAIPGTYQAGISQIQLQRADWGTSINGTIAINSLDPSQLIVDWDEDTFPSNTDIVSDTNTRGTVDLIIDPQKYNPTINKTAGQRLLLLGAIGDADNQDGADAWKDNSNNDFVAGANDIIEWDGNSWNVIFDASEQDPDAEGFEMTYTTNLNTGVQYKFNGSEWVLSFEGEYRKGTWRIVL